MRCLHSKDNKIVIDKTPCEMYMWCVEIFFGSPREDRTLACKASININCKLETGSTHQGANKSKEIVS